MTGNLLLLGVALVAALFAPVWVVRWTRWVEWPVKYLAPRRGRAIVAVGLLSFVVAAGLSLAGPLPQPAVHDEFSYLLAADTFAHGRLTNPTPPLWPHFESMHILVRPTYASKYPSGQGLALAAGQVLTGYPIVGVWLSTALACAAITWALFGWLPPRWAVLGGMLATIHPLMLLWGHTYWGGAVAAAGGALVVGAVPRLLGDSRVRDAAWLGAGLLILANSRPFEGLVLSALMGGYLAFQRLARRRAGRTLGLVTVVLPSALFLAAGGVGMALYNRAVTGDVSRLPYQEHQAQYAAAPPFLWLPPRPEPVYRHTELRDFYVGFELASYERQHTLWGLASETAGKAGTLFQAFGLPALLLGLAGVWTAANRVLVGGIALFALVLLTETWMHPHYAAPAAALVFVPALRGLRRVRVRRPIGLALVRASLLLSLVSASVFAVQMVQAFSHGWHQQRARMIDQLHQQGGKHLILVRYGPNHSVHAEWVYNGADIDGATVIWAREMSPAENANLIEHYAGRRVWLLEADAPTPKLEPYSSG